MVRLTADHDYKHQTGAGNRCCADRRERGQQDDDDVVCRVECNVLGRGQEHYHDGKIDGCSIHVDQTAQGNCELCNSDWYALRQHTADGDWQRCSTRGRTPGSDPSRTTAHPHGVRVLPYEGEVDGRNKDEKVDDHTA